VTDLGQETHEQEHLILKAFGFKTHQDNKKVNSLEKVFLVHDQIKNKGIVCPMKLMV